MKKIFLMMFLWNLFFAMAEGTSKDPIFVKTTDDVLEIISGKTLKFYDLSITEDFETSKRKLINYSKDIIFGERIVEGLYYIVPKKQMMSEERKYSDFTISYYEGQFYYFAKYNIMGESLRVIKNYFIKNGSKLKAGNYDYYTIDNGIFQYKFTTKEGKGFLSVVNLDLRKIVIPKYRELQ